MPTNLSQSAEKPSLWYSLFVLLILSVGVVASVATSSPWDDEPVCGDGIFEFGEICYESAISLQAEKLPSSVTLFDIEKDGDLDILITNQASNSVSIIRNEILTGRVPFRNLLSIPVGESPISLVVEDLDADGFPDIVVVNQGSNDVSLLFGQEDNTFVAATPLRVGVKPSQVKVTDLNGDEIPDIITTNQGSDDISVLFGTGARTFETQITFAVGIAPVDFAIDDFAGPDFPLDGIPDLITANQSSNDLSILLGNETEIFAPAIEVAIGENPSSIVLNDFNENGFLDIFVANQNENSVKLLTNKSKSTFELSKTIEVGANPSSIQNTDLNQKGKFLDLVVSNEGSNQVMLLNHSNSIDGGFRIATTRSVGDQPTAVTTGDLNLDGVLDIVTANSGSNDISVILSSP